jgi:hypothetical protein
MFFHAVTSKNPQQDQPEGSNRLMKNSDFMSLRVPIYRDKAISGAEYGAKREIASSLRSSQ